MKLNIYQKTAITTVLAVIFLIFVGGLVRASGSGLGCPDWPTCFGLWIPPTSAGDLPAGFDSTQFNMFKTWTEYVNRLVGVIIGLLITATCILSFRYRKEKPSIFYSSLAAFVMVIFQGWLGGQVVKSGLNAWLITIHMVLAMGIMIVLLYATFKATEERWTLALPDKARSWLFWVGILLFVMTMIQMVLGTEVREAIDQIAKGGTTIPRGQWLDRIGSMDEIHRTFSWTVFLSGLGLGFLVNRKTSSTLLRALTALILGVIILQIALGAGLYYLEMPPVFQVSHLVGIALLICFEFIFLLVVRHSQNKMQ